MIKNFLNWHDQKWVWSVWSWDSKIVCISRMNWWNELIFSWWCKFGKGKSYFNDFWVGLVKNGRGHLVHETLKSTQWVYWLSWFFVCWLWCNNFLLGRHCTFYFWLLNANLLQFYILVSPLAVAGRILFQNRVCPSFPPDICRSVFLEFDH